MDEGFNTLIDLANAARYFGGTAYGDSIEVHPLQLYPDHAIPGREEPLIGRDRFDHAFRQYLRAWAYKHPTPATSSASCAMPPGWTSISSGATGYTRPRASTRWCLRSPRSRATRRCSWSNRGTMTLPLELELSYAGGATERVRLPVEMWNLGPRFAYRVRGERPVTGVGVDPRAALPDVDRTNNRLPR